MSTAKAVRERPILFTAPMVRAILEGRKTQTRRPAKFVSREAPFNLLASSVRADYYASNAPERGWVLCSRGVAGQWTDRTFPLKCPYGQPGDRLWVRETFAIECNSGWQDAYSEPSKPLGPVRWHDDGDGGEYFEAPRYRASEPDTILGEDEDGMRWQPSIHMPRWASRITLEVTGVRVERVQAISEVDAKAERYHGEFSPGGTMTRSPRAQFSESWARIYGARGLGWDANPWVWVVEFRKVAPDA